MGQACHLVPRFYLDGWSKGNRMLSIRRGTGQCFPLKPEKAAFETDAYAVILPGGDKSYEAEEALAQLEGEAAAAMRRALADWPPSDEDKGHLSLLMVTQVTRGRDLAEHMNTILDYLTRTQFAMMPSDEESLKQRLRDANLEITDENLELVREMINDPDGYRVQMHQTHRVHSALKVGLDLYPHFYLRVWHLVTIPQRLFITTDRPVSLHADEESRGPFGSIGLMTADEVWMPLSPSELLVMTHPGTGPARRGTLRQDQVESVNLRVAANCHEWAFARPGNPQAEEITMMLAELSAPGVEIGGPSPAEWGQAAKGRGRQT